LGTLSATSRLLRSHFGSGAVLAAGAGLYFAAWWTKAVKDVPPTFNVHARRVTEPFFWSAFKRNRCIIPASGYFEWKTMPDGKKPYYISAADGGVLSIAGVGHLEQH
jgi:putative SOS response-associated peptidase YedK